MTPKATYSYDTSYGHVTVTEFYVPRDVMDHIRDAIDKGGGYSVDIEGVIRELNAAGYVIVPKEPTEAMCAAGAKYYHDNWQPGHAKDDTSMSFIWADMIEAAPKT
jgi:hypothetical protein